MAEEVTDKRPVIDAEFKEVQKRLLIGLTQEFESDLGHKKIMKRVAKSEKYGNKVNDMCLKSFNRHFERIVDELFNKTKTIEIINENGFIVNETIDKTINNLIEKQTKIEEINETILKQSLDFNDIKSEETRLQCVERVLCPQNQICFDAIKKQLRQSPNDS